mgnify:CR=1 FL=1
MKFTSTLIKGKLIKRYKRFFVDIKVNNKILTAHCPNTGSMMGLLDQGNDVWISKSDDPKRKLKFTLEIIKVGKKMIGINTHRANKIVKHGLENKLINEFMLNKNIKPEYKYSDDTRFDFLCDDKLLEVKNVTLIRKNIAQFPDAKTERGTKHLNELCNAKKKGYQSYILYLIQRENCDSFKIAKDIDEKYKIAFTKALKSGVKILCYDCKLNNEEIKLNKQINYEQ